jgi:hypothetical protein
MASAESLGLTYLLPENRYAGQQQPQAQPQDEALNLELPKTDQDLAHVEGLTDKYINTRGLVEKYATDMQKKYGINVTQPDYTQPGGGIPFKTYQKLATQLLVTANDLKQSQSQENVYHNLEATGQIRRVDGFDENKQPVNRQNFDDMYYSTKLLPEVEQANHILKTTVNSSSDQQRFKSQVLDPLVAKLTARMNQPGISQSEKQQLKYNIDALVQQPYQTPYAYYQGQYNPHGSGKKNTIEEDVLRDTTNLANGKWTKGNYSVDTNDEGDPILINKKREGEQYGEHVYEDGKGQQKRVARVIDHWEKRPDGVYLVFKQPGDIEIPAEKVSDKRGDAVASTIISSNAKYGDVRKMYEAAREKGYTDESGSVVNDKLLATDQEFDTPHPDEFAAGTTAEKSRIKKQLELQSDPGLFFKNKSKVEFNLPSGDKVEFFKHRVGEGFYLSGQEDNENFNHMTQKDIVNYLAQQGYFKKFLPSQDAPAAKTVVNPGGKKPY